MLVLLNITTIARYLLYVLIPILAFYIGYLIITKAFNDMGFSKFEAVVIIAVSFLFEFEMQYLEVF